MRVCHRAACLFGSPSPPGIPAAASLPGVMGCLYPVSLRSRPMASCPHNTARNARKHCSPLPPPALLDSSIPPSFPWPNLYCPWWKPCQGSRLERNHWVWANVGTERSDGGIGRWRGGHRLKGARRQKLRKKWQVKTDKSRVPRQSWTFFYFSMSYYVGYG